MSWIEGIEIYDVLWNVVCLKVFWKGIKWFRAVSFLRKLFDV